LHAGKEYRNGLGKLTLRLSKIKTTGDKDRLFAKDAMTYGCTSITISGEASPS
jgi:hypothetical protein